MSSEAESEGPGSSGMSRSTTTSSSTTATGGGSGGGGVGSSCSGGGVGGGAPTSSRRQMFLDIVRQSNVSCQNGDYPAAVTLYTEALKIDLNNHILYSNRSAAFIKMGQFSKALQDALKARDLNPKWAKAYYRHGVALQCLGKHHEALAAFSGGLAKDPKSGQLLGGLIEAATKSPLKGNLEPTFAQLEIMKLGKSAFVVISVIGQELLGGHFYSSSVILLENALKIGTSNLKLKGSVFSALSSAYWALNSLDKAISYMQQDLAVAKSLGDVVGECRAHGNLGSAYFSKANYKDALTSHRYQLVLAMKCKDSHAAAAALTSLGHVYTAIGDYANALASHKQCVQLVKQTGDILQEGREIGNVGAVYLVMGDFDNAIDCHLEHLRIAKQLRNKIEEARSYSNLGSSYHYRRNYDQAITFHNHVLQIAHELHDQNIEARAYAGLGHAARCVSDYSMAKMWHEKQLDMALGTKDKVSEGRACSNLGIVYQLLGDHDTALKLHQSHLSIALSLHDRTGMGRAYGNIGNAYNAMGFYEQAIKYHKHELAISKEVNDRSSEASTHGNLAVAYQALGMYEKALVHYHSHLNISRELKDTSGEACALLNLGNCHSSHREFSQAVPFYENYLMLSQELHDLDGEAKACHFLGYAHYCLGNFKEAVRYYDQDLTLAKDLQNKINISRAYCNLGLTHLALGNYEIALECQKFFLTFAHSTKSIPSKFRALGNIGNVMLKLKKPEEAINVYQKQVMLAKSNGDKALEASAYGALGMAYRTMKRYDRALGFHAQELTLLREIHDSRGEYRAHGNLGAVHMSLGNYSSAIKCYDEMLQRAKELQDFVTEAQAYGNIGIARINMGSYEDAATYFEQQLTVLESLCSLSSSSSAAILIEKGRAYGNLGDCFSALCDHEEAIRCHEKSLQISIKIGHVQDQEKTLRSIALAFKSLGNSSQAIISYEKRLGVIISSDENEFETTLKVGAYGDLGLEQLEATNFEQAISCFHQQLNISKDKNDRTLESVAVSNLGKSFQRMGDFNEALQYHEMDLHIAEEIGSILGKVRSYGNIGLAHESLGNLEQALIYQEQHLNSATKIEDFLSQTIAFSSIGRIHHTLGNNIQAVAYLQQALQLVEKLEAKEEQAKICHFLGLALWRQGDLESAQAHLEKSTDLLENIRLSVSNCSSSSSAEYSLVLFDRQIASYQALQRIFVPMGRTDLTLLVAEKSRTIANMTLLRRREAAMHSNNTTTSTGGVCKSTMGEAILTTTSTVPTNLISTIEDLVQRVNRHRSAMLYFSIAGGYLYSWLLIPERGIVKFNECCLNTDAENTGDEETLKNMGSKPKILEQYIQGTRDSLGIDFNISGSSRNLATLDPDSLTDMSTDLWSQHLEELGDKLNQENDKTGFLRMVSRNHRFNCSSYSLSSLFSVGSATGSVKSTPSSRPGSTRTKSRAWQGPSCLRSLYQMLIAPFEEELSVLDKTCFKELILVLETDLLLVPFPILRSSPSEDYLCGKFKLIVAPSISSIRSGTRRDRDSHGRLSLPLLIGNPKLPESVIEQWGWEDIPRSEHEVNMIAEIFQTQPLIGIKATKETLLREMCSAEVVHLATHISWKLSAIVLSPATDNKKTNVEDSDGIGCIVEDTPSLSDYLLTAADILKLRVCAKLVVLSSCHTKDKQGVVNSDSIIALSKALLAAGAMAVLITLWPVPETASMIFFRALYSSLLQGSKVSHALAEGMSTVQHTKHFAHPANWSGYLLIGSDVQLTNKVALTGQAIWELLKNPDRSRDVLRVTLHLVEKSLQRISNGQRNAMYTTQKSIENKVGNVSGWKEILMSVGFRFEPASNGLPAAVFFPQSDPGERLVKCSASLQALLGLPQPSILALSKLLSTPEAGEDVISILRQAIAEMALKDLDADKVELKINVKLWGMAGCHELLASLGFDLIEVGENEVILGIGRHVNLRMLQLALQAALSLFDALGEVDENNTLERSVSLESLEMNTEELCLMVPSLAPSMPAAAYLPVRQTIGMGQGAFTSYVRSRGEPDGHTNNASEDKSHCQHNFSSSTFDCLIPRSNVPRQQVHPIYQSIAVQRADSSSSGSSMTDWENGLSTVRRRAPPLPPNISMKDPLSAALSGFDSQGSDNEFMLPPPIRNRLPVSTGSKSNVSILYGRDQKRVTWKVNKDNPVSTSAPTPGNGNGNKPWLKMRNVFLAGNGKPNIKSQILPNLPETMLADGGTEVSTIREHLKSTNASQITRELTISDVYHERNLGLGLAPPLSKLLLTNRLNLSQIENPGSENCGNKSDLDLGAVSMDDTMSTFDQLSLAEDSAPENNNCNTTRPKPKVKPKMSLPPVPMKRTLNPPNKLGSSSTTNNTEEPLNLSLNLSPRPNNNGGEVTSSSSSSKSSPSDLSRRDEGDGRSLTDSQYGSYSPSMAQNDLIQTAAAAYFASRLEKQQETKPISIEMTTSSNCTKNRTPTSPDKKYQSSSNSSSSNNNDSSDPTIVVNNNNNNSSNSNSNISKRIAKHSPIRNCKTNNNTSNNSSSSITTKNSGIPTINFTSFGQKSSEC